MSELLTLKEAAAYLRVHYETAKGYVSDGRLPAYRIGGGKIRISKDQLQQYLDSTVRNVK